MKKPTKQTKPENFLILFGNRLTEKLQENRIAAGNRTAQRPSMYLFLDYLLLTFYPICFIIVHSLPLPLLLSLPHFTHTLFSEPFYTSLCTSCPLPVNISMLIS